MIEAFQVALTSVWMDSGFVGFQMGQGIMIVVGLVRTIGGDAPIAESAGLDVRAESLTQAAIILLLLRSFASG